MAQDWRTIRVFISSTFKDMQAERDHLVRFVFPRLREELLNRRIHLVDVDLRWGVTSEQDALEVCKEIIDECRPRFVCILGGRYGWTPPGKEESITAAEVHYAVLNRLAGQEYRFFYFRDPKVTDAIPEAQAREDGYREFPLPEDVEQFGLDEAEARVRRRTVKLEALKQAVSDAGLVPFIYPARWDEVEGLLTDLNAFGEQVYRDLLWSIDDELGTEAPPELDEFASEAAAMDAFIEERLAGYVVGSRQRVLDDLTAFAAGEGEPNILVITGAAGTGKSALLAKFCRVLTKASPEWLVIPHFVGASVGSTDLRRTMRRLCHELSLAIGDAEKLPQSIQDLLPRLNQLLQQVSSSKRVVLVIDALNQLDAAENAHSLHWLPLQLPPPVRIIMSSLEHSTLEALRRRGERVKEKSLKPLSKDDSLAIIHGFLTRHHKAMTAEQVQALLANEESGSPLYLLIALEELRTLGTYEEITQRIEELPGRAKELFIWIFRRLEDDPGFRDATGNRIGPELMRGFASMMAVSRHGLSQLELAELLAPGDPEAIPPIPHDPQGNVAALLRLLRPYLMHRWDLLDFYHSQVREAAEANYLKGDFERLGAHGHLADYFKAKADPGGDLTWSGNYLRGVAELPYHQSQAGRWGDFRVTLTSPLFLRAKLTGIGLQPLISDYDLATSLPLFAGRSENPEEIETLRLIQSGLRLSAHILLWDPGQMASQLTGRLLGQGSQKTMDFLKDIRRTQTVPWLRPFTRSLLAPEGHLMRTLCGHKFSVEGVKVYERRGWAVSVSYDSTLKVWDLETGQELRTLTGHTAGVRYVAIWQERGWAISASIDGTLKIWDLETGQELQELRAVNKHTDEIRGVALWQERSWAISAHKDGSLKVWDLDSRQELRTLAGHTMRVNDIAVYQKKGWAVSVSYDSTLKVWDLETGQELRTLAGHTGGVRSVAVWQEHGWAISASYDWTLKVWDLETGQEVYSLKDHTNRLTGVAVYQKRGWAVSTSWDVTLKVWSLKDLQKQLMQKWHPRSGHTSAVSDIAVYFKESWAVSASYDKTLKVWDLETGHELRTLTGHTSTVSDIAVYQKKGWAISVSQDETLKIWAIETGHELRTILGPNWVVTWVAVYEERGWAVSASLDGTLEVWDLETGQKLRTLRGNYFMVNDIAVYDLKGWAVYTSSWDYTDLSVWDLETGRELRTLKGHADKVRGLDVWSEKGWAVSASTDRAIKVWDINTGLEIVGIITDVGCLAVVMDPGSSTIAAGGSMGEMHFLRLEGV